MLYRDIDSRIRHKGISKDIDDFYAYDGSEEYEEEYDDINDRADYEYEKMMDERAERLCKDQ